MVDLNLIRDIGSDAEINRMLADALGSDFDERTMTQTPIATPATPAGEGTILKGKILGRVGNEVLLDVGLKSEGLISADEWDDQSQIQPGADIEVLLDEVQPDTGIVVLSK